MFRFLFIANLMIGSVVFNSFVDWYDTGRWSSDRLIPVAFSALGLTAIVMLVEQRIARRFDLQPHRRWASRLFWIVLCMLIISLSFGVGSGQGLSGAAILAFFFLPMSAPFGLVAGLVGSWLMQRIHQSRSNIRTN